MVDVPPITSDLRYVMCLYPKLIRNRKYMINNKNGGIIPPVKDDRVLLVAVGCQNCIECRKQKSREWLSRLNEDIKVHKNAHFVTLTFSDESYNELRKEVPYYPDEYKTDNEIATLAVRRFLERWRKKYSKSVRHWLITELGGGHSERIHLHGLIYTDNKNDIDLLWKYGYTWLGYSMNESVISYVIKYCHKTDLVHKNYKPIILCSKGIGRNYIDSHNATINRYKGTKTKETYTLNNGKEIGLPKYYRNNIYNDDERESLWLNLLDKNKRYVLGQEINMTDENSIKEYYTCLDIARAKNARLGFGSDEINWELKRYENERRKLIRKQKRS